MPRHYFKSFKGICIAKFLAPFHYVTVTPSLHSQPMALNYGVLDSHVLACRTHQSFITALTQLLATQVTAKTGVCGRYTKSIWRKSVESSTNIPRPVRCYTSTLYNNTLVQCTHSIFATLSIPRYSYSYDFKFCRF